MSYYIAPVLFIARLVGLFIALLVGLFVAPFGALLGWFA